MDLQYDIYHFTITFFKAADIGKSKIFWDDCVPYAIVASTHLECHLGKNRYCQNKEENAKIPLQVRLTCMSANLGGCIPPIF